MGENEAEIIMKYFPIIGLEVHVELATKSKMFCGCPAEHFGVNPNSHTCPVCLGLPGALPVPNKKAIEWTILLGLALGCKINLESKFDRKNYFYPDLPKGYQITQYDEPFCVDGKLTIRDMREVRGVREIRIRRVHLEEDTGKLQHERVKGQQVTLVDFNRSGVPLVEIVTEPDFRSIEEVDVYLKNLQKIIRYLGISNADMEKGSMRLEPSISLKATTDGEIIFPLVEDQLPKYRVELKNINSFRFARKALEFEIKRQTDLLDKGEKPVQQTRGWDDVKNHTYAQREKEEAHDYRYFPEPDIPPLKITKLQIENLRKSIPELPLEKSARYQSELGLSSYDADLISGDKTVAQFFETAIETGKEVPVKEVANWIINKKIDITKDMPVQLIAKIHSSKTSVATDEGELEKALDAVIKENAKAVADYKAGKIQVFGFLIGMTLRKIKADRTLVEVKLKSRL